MSAGAMPQRSAHPLSRYLSDICQTSILRPGSSREQALSARRAADLLPERPPLQQQRSGGAQRPLQSCGCLAEALQACQGTSHYFYTLCRARQLCQSSAGRSAGLQSTLQAPPTPVGHWHNGRATSICRSLHLAHHITGAGSCTMFRQIQWNL